MADHQSHYLCPHCPCQCNSRRGLTQHINACHPRPGTSPFEIQASEEDQEVFTYTYHSQLNATPCDADGNFLPRGTPPQPSAPSSYPPSESETWAPFEDRHSFDFAYYHFTELQNSGQKINKALDMWAASVLKYGDRPPWSSAEEMYATIDEIQEGDCPWKVYRIQYNGPRPNGTPPQWMSETYELCTRDSRQLLHEQLRTPDFNDKFNTKPYMQFKRDGKRVWSNLMSGDWAWKQADMIAQDPKTHGSMLIPIVAGSDRTTVSVATGHQEYHPVYMSPGNVTNTARRAHGNAVLPVAFLPIPKTSKRQRKTELFQRFCRQTYHACLAQVFLPLRHGMTTPEVVKCPDGHFRRAVYGLGPYIADYPEQVWLSGIVQYWCPKCNARPDSLDEPGSLRRSHIMTEYLIKIFDPGTLWDDYGIRSDIVPFTSYFPRADIHELLSPDLLHQVIKGTFKDHLVTWVNAYLHVTHGEARALEIIQDIDWRISAVPTFPGIRRFRDGRDFNQWTGDDSKALMKVYLAAITGYVPSEMVQCLSAFLDFCYIARRNSLTSDDLKQLEAALKRFHQHRAIFINTGVRVDISLPRQHSLMHYLRSIRLFGSPNGLCSSITESKHIKAVKEPWRRSSRFNALPQMLLILCRLDKLATARRSFMRRGMMDGSTSSYTAMILRGEHPVPQPAPTYSEDDDDGEESCGPLHGPRVMSSISLASTRERNYPSLAPALGQFIGQARLPDLIRRFLWQQQNPSSMVSSRDIPIELCPSFDSRISVFHSAIAHFYAPSDICGAGGMHHERIRSNPRWRGEYPRYDTVMVNIDPNLPGMEGMVVGRVRLFFSLIHDRRVVPCALVNWLVQVDDKPDKDTGIWVVSPEFESNRQLGLSAEVIHLDTIVRSAHLLPVYGRNPLPEDFHFSLALDAFRAFFVNPYPDHHMHQLLKE